MKFKKLIAVVVGALAIPSVSFAGEDSQLSVEGQLMITRAAAPAHMETVDEIFSGWAFRKDETQALQMDDFDNPAFILIDKAIYTFSKVEGSAGKACVSCHESPEVFKGLRASMPRINSSGELETIPELVNG